MTKLMFKNKLERKKLLKETGEVSKKTKVKLKKVQLKEAQAADGTFFDPYKVLKFPLSTEKVIKMIEFENKLVFVVSAQATKTDVKRAVEEMFKVKVINVNIQNCFTGQRKAYVKISPEFLASDISAELGLI